MTVISMIRMNFLIDDEFTVWAFNNIPVLLDANSAEGFNGYTVMRVRLCSASNTLTVCQDLSLMGR